MVNTKESVKILERCGLWRRQNGDRGRKGILISVSVGNLSQEQFDIFKLYASMRNKEINGFPTKVQGIFEQPQEPKRKVFPPLTLGINSTDPCILVQLAEPILTKLSIVNPTSGSQTLNPNFTSFLPALSNI